MGIASPTIGADTTAVTMLRATVETELQPPAVSEMVLPRQSPTAESHLGRSFRNTPLGRNIPDINYP